MGNYKLSSYEVSAILASGHLMIENHYRSARVTRDKNTLLRIRAIYLENPLHWATDGENAQQFPTAS
jgi:hypothetical protein